LRISRAGAAGYAVSHRAGGLMSVLPQSCASGGEMSHPLRVHHLQRPCNGKLLLPQRMSRMTRQTDLRHTLRAVVTAMTVALMIFTVTPVVATSGLAEFSDKHTQKTTAHATPYIYVYSLFEEVAPGKVEMGTMVLYNAATIHNIRRYLDELAPDIY